MLLIYASRWRGFGRVVANLNDASNDAAAQREYAQFVEAKKRRVMTKLQKQIEALANALDVKATESLSRQNKPPKGSSKVLWKQKCENYANAYTACAMKVRGLLND